MGRFRCSDEWRVAVGRFVHTKTHYHSDELQLYSSPLFSYHKTPGESERVRGERYEVNNSVFIQVRFTLFFLIKITLSLSSNYFIHLFFFLNKVIIYSLLNKKKNYLVISIIKHWGRGWFSKKKKKKKK